MVAIQDPTYYEAKAKLAEAMLDRERNSQNIRTPDPQARATLANYLLNQELDRQIMKQETRGSAAGFMLERRLQTETEKREIKNARREKIFAGAKKAADTSFAYGGKALDFTGKIAKYGFDKLARPTKLAVDKITHVKDAEKMYKRDSGDASRVRALEEELRKQGINLYEFYESFGIRRGEANGEGASSEANRVIITPSETNRTNNPQKYLSPPQPLLTGRRVLYTPSSKDNTTTDFDNLVERVINAYRNSNRKSTSSKVEEVAANQKIKKSDVNKILYGREINVEGFNDKEKSRVLRLYNTGKGSMKGLADHFTKRLGKKMTTDKIYKILYEMNNKGQTPNWRTMPSSLENYYRKQN
jgi:hypothetical protein